VPVKLKGPLFCARASILIVRVLCPVVVLTRFHACLAPFPSRSIVLLALHPLVRSVCAFGFRGAGESTFGSVRVNQRPDLYGAAVAQVGVLDMLRFHQFTIGAMWQSHVPKWTASNPFDVLYECSPYHSVKRLRQCPSTLLMTADHEDCVVPAHSFKLMATLHAAVGEEAAPFDLCCSAE
jgi:hypothetical protein